MFSRMIFCTYFWSIWAGLVSRIGKSFVKMIFILSFLFSSVRFILFPVSSWYFSLMWKRTLSSGVLLSFFILKFLIKIDSVSTCSIVLVASVVYLGLSFVAVEQAVSRSAQKIKMIEVLFMVGAPFYNEWC